MGTAAGGRPIITGQGRKGVDALTNHHCTGLPHGLRGALVEHLDALDDIVDAETPAHSVLGDGRETRDRKDIGGAQELQRCAKGNVAVQITDVHEREQGAEGLESDT
jgi:hypothetical protein